MTNTRDSDFDPRFDPAFQRGFDGEGQRMAPARSVAREQQAAPVISAPPVAQVAPSAPVAGDSERVDAAAEVEQQRGANPFLIALGVVAVALVAAGAWAIQAAREPFLRTDAASNVDYVGQQILQIAGPLAVTLGIATAIGLLFVFAADWQRRRR